MNKIVFWFLLCLLELCCIRCEKIIGGQDVEPNSIPYQLVISYSYGTILCGGSIYNNMTVITSASCCDYLNPSDIIVVAGEHNLKTPSETEQVIRISTIIMYPMQSNAHTGNLCLMKTLSPFIFNEFVSSISFPKENDEFEGNAVVSGWGVHEINGTYSKTLKAITIPLLSLEECQKAHSEKDLDETVICAGENTRDSCFGDWGGPLTFGGVQIGVVSWDKSCGQNNVPSIYVKTSKFVKWISENAF